MPYLDYTVGTITLINGSRSVTGTKTYWLQNIHANDILKVMIPDQNTGQVVSDFYTIQQVVSDTQLYLTKEYTGEAIADSNYAIQRLTEQSLSAELTTRQMKILEGITGINAALDESKEHATQAGISANVARQYASEAENHMNAAIAAADRAETLEQDYIQYRDEAKHYSEVSTEQAGISTTQAGVSTEQAGVSTEQANIAIETVRNFLDSGNNPGGAVIISPDGKIPVDLIPGSVQDVKSYPSMNDFPVTGETGFIYLARDTQKVYLWASEPDNMYIPIDTQIGLAGTGSAETAARSDHHHNGVYEPAHPEFVWSGSIDTVINLDTTFIKDGNYMVTAPIQIEVEGLMIYVNILYLKTYGDYQFQLAIFYNIGMNIISTRTVQFSGHTITHAPNWSFSVASDSLRLNGIQYHFVTKQQYDTGINDGSIEAIDVAFIEENATDSPSFAVKSVNGMFPDGTGDITIDNLGSNTILANPTDYPLYRNANNIKNDGERVIIVVALYGSVENYPVNTDVNSMFLRCYSAGTIKFQECSVLKSDGSMELWQRFGTTTAWQQWNKISGSMVGGEY